jgi:predicted HicB family RNase H-like nuclease
MDILKYKDYEGSAELDMTRGVCRGKILFIDDLVTYLATCEALGKNPLLPCRGQFNVRTPPALHRAAQRRAAADKISLNEVVVRAIEAFVHT